MPPYCWTAPAPALYAARASPAPNRNLAISPERILAAPLTRWPAADPIGFTPIPLAVEGMICISPSAPAELTADGLKPDSVLATAANSVGGET